MPKKSPNNSVERGKVVISDKIVDPKFWGAFKIPAYAFALVALLLVLRNSNSNPEFSYIQLIANYAIGASIISYCHSLTHSTWLNHKKGPDLPLLIQIVFMSFHVTWFGFAVIIKHA
jgi:hypothetical protein